MTDTWVEKPIAWLDDNCCTSNLNFKLYCHSDNCGTGIDRKRTLSLQLLGNSL
jgi:hypothetical protein